MDVLERMVRDGKITVYEVVQKASLDRLDEVLAMLKRHDPATDLCTALLARIARAPLDQFSQLKAIFLHHCASGTTQTGQPTNRPRFS
jgi:hypothetical protein